MNFKTKGNRTVFHSRLKLIDCTADIQLLCEGINFIESCFVDIACCKLQSVWIYKLHVRTKYMCSGGGIVLQADM